MGADAAKLLSVVTPAFNEAENLPVFYKRLCDALKGAEFDWEWIVVDDHSKDRTFAVLQELSSQDARVRGLRFTRNFGAHSAVRCGIEESRGQCTAVMAVDLQDPPELLPELVAQWKSGAKVVWASRRSRPGETRMTLGFSSLYYFLMRRLVGLRELPPTGADFFVIDRAVVAALSQFRESNLSLFALIAWMGFPSATLPYDKEPRVRGRSGWSLEKKLKLAIDSITSFTYLPIRLISYVGFLCAFLGFVYAGAITVRGFLGKGWPEGWASLMVVLLVMGGIQMLMMGLLGEYLWRTLEESRQRPRYLIETRSEGPKEAPAPRPEETRTTNA